MNKTSKKRLVAVLAVVLLSGCTTLDQRPSVSGTGYSTVFTGTLKHVVEAKSDQPTHNKHEGVLQQVGALLFPGSTKAALALIFIDVIAKEMIDYTGTKRCIYIIKADDHEMVNRVIELSTGMMYNKKHNLITLVQSCNHDLRIDRKVLLTYGAQGGTISKLRV